jgi:predicted ATPase
MSKLQIRNFGPIKNGFNNNGNHKIDIKKVTIFIGNQGSGKSSVAKLFSTLSWIEKALVRGNIDSKDLTTYKRFQKKYCAYQNIHNYFRKNTFIEYEGEAYILTYQNETFKIIEKQDKSKYLLPKIMYVPAERNFVSAVSQPEKLKYLPQTLFTFLDEYQRSIEEIESNIKLPINNLTFKFDKKRNVTKLVGNDYELLLTEASSGLQSLVPLFVVSKNLAEGINHETDFTKNKSNLEEIQNIRKRLQDIISNDKLPENLKIQAINLIAEIYNNDCFINVVEEPEQNLYPTSQKEILSSLIEYNNLNQGNELVITTHSPYLINYLTLSIKANEIYNNLINSNTQEKHDLIKEEINSIVSLKSLVNKNDFAIYQLSDEGDIRLLETLNGLPSDENYLNQNLAELNYLFTDLLEIEDKWK